MKTYNIRSTAMKTRKQRHVDSKTGTTYKKEKENRRPIVSFHAVLYKIIEITTTINY